MTRSFCLCEERQRLRGVAEANSEQDSRAYARNRLRNLAGFMLRDCRAFGSQ